MTVKEFLDKVVRPLIGDTYVLVNEANVNAPQLSVPTTQVVKYPEEVLLDILNEAVQDISEYSKFFKRDAVALIRVGDTRLTVPDDFKGFYEATQTAVGTAPNLTVDIPTINLIPTRDGIEIQTPVTPQDLASYKEAIAGITVPDELINILVESNQIEVPDNALLVDIGDAILCRYTYLALPKELTITDNIEDRELRNTLKWFVASYASDLDMHNEASNLSTRYWNKYKRRLETVGVSRTNWNAVSLSPYLPRP